MVSIFHVHVCAEYVGFIPIPYIYKGTGIHVNWGCKQRCLYKSQCVRKCMYCSYATCYGSCYHLLAVMPGDYPPVWWYNSPTDRTYHSFNVVYVCSSVPTVFGNKQQQYMEMIKQMLTSCLAEQSEVKLTASQALQYWSLKKHVATLTK